MPEFIRIRILNRDYSLQVSKGNEHRIREIARYVDTEIRQFQRDHPDQSDITAPVIVALDLAEKLFAEREKRNAAEAGLQEDIGQIMASLDEALPVGEKEGPAQSEP